MSQSLQADEELCDFLAPDDDSLELLETNSFRLPFPEYPIGEETRWFPGQDVLLRDDDGAATWPAAGRQKTSTAFLT